MSEDRWLDIKPILAKALDLSATERREFLDSKCKGDEKLRSEIENYLETASASDLILGSPLVEILENRDPPLKKSDELGKFRIEERIGRGGMSLVYRASAGAGPSKDQVAIKVLRTGFNNGEFLERFRQEQIVLARLSHPFLPKVLESGLTQDGLPYFAMELVEGQRLDQVLAEMKDIKQRLGVFLRICKAIEFVHSHRIVHCDIKPSNILVDRAGYPKVLDFGIAILLRNVGNSTNKQRLTASQLGSIPFASPEQVSGESISHRSDIYSLGGLLYLVLLGEAPNTIGPPLFLADLDSPQARSLFQTASALPYASELERVIRKALSFQPSDRQTSVTELIQELLEMDRTLDPGSQLTLPQL